MKFELNDNIKETLNLYPKLKLYDDENSQYLKGELDIFDDDDNYCYTYSIRLNIPKNYPYSFPNLFEENNKIPKVADRHMYKSGECCVCIMQEEDVRSKHGITIKQFIKEFAIPFFANQIYYENNEKKEWANGDYKHGIDGIVQFYQELFKCTSLKNILLEIENAININIKHYEKCFCGSGIKYKKCHRNIHNELMKLSRKRILLDYKFIYIQNENKAKSQ